MITWDKRMHLAPRDGTPILLYWEQDNGKNPEWMRMSDRVTVGIFTGELWAEYVDPQTVRYISAVGYKPVRWCPIEIKYQQDLSV